MTGLITGIPCYSQASLRGRQERLTPTATASAAGKSTAAGDAAASASCAAGRGTVSTRSIRLYLIAQNRLQGIAKQGWVHVAFERDNAESFVVSDFSPVKLFDQIQNAKTEVLGDR